MRKNSQSGFTLIELVVVIVILATLAAVALPKFANLQAQARIAKMNGALGAMKSASSMGHAVVIANNYAATDSPTITIENTSIKFANGYPDAASIAPLAGVATPDYVIDTTGAPVAKITPDAGHPNCVITYTEATKDTTGGTTTYGLPAFNASALTVDNCI